MCVYSEGKLDTRKNILQRLENVDRTHLVLAKDKLVKQEERNMNQEFLMKAKL